MAVIVMVSVMFGGYASAQSAPPTNYENSGVVSEMIGSNAAGLTAYSSDFIARFTNESAASRINTEMVRLRNRHQASQLAAFPEKSAERRQAPLGFLFAESETRNAERDVRQVRKVLRRHELKPELIQALTNSLRGLLSGQQIDAKGFAEATNTYNRIIEEIRESSVTDPPQELLSIRAVLASLAKAVAGREGESPTGYVSGSDSMSPERSRLPSPDSLEGIVTKTTLIMPGTATATPTAFGARWGQVYGGISYQPVSRYATVSEYDWQEGKWSDATISLGVGIGNPNRGVGLDVTMNIFDTLFGALGASNDFGEVRTLSLKIHRALPHESAVALGYENAWYSRSEEAQGGSSIYGVLTKVFGIREQRATIFSRATLSVGLGTDRFLPESQFRRQVKGVNVFGSIGVRLWSFMNIVADWTGQDLNVGVSVTPVPRFPIVLTPALVDVTGKAGDQVRFSIGAAMTYDFRR